MRRRVGPMAEQNDRLALTDPLIVNNGTDQDEASGVEIDQTQTHCSETANDPSSPALPTPPSSSPSPSPSSTTADLDDGSDDAMTVVSRLLLLGVIGSGIGLVLPKNNDLPTPWYRSVSAAIGYTYFLCWSVSFYPQVIINFRRRSTKGLSNDFCILNVVGFACYTVYNVAFFCSPYVRELYKERHGGETVLVQSNDVAFAVHALVISIITVGQIAWYNRCSTIQGSHDGDGGNDSSNRQETVENGLHLEAWTQWVLRGIFVVCGVYTGLTLSGTRGCNWLDLLYLLSSIKILISLIKYIPQAVLNHQRKSTKGWSIWNVLLDSSGGVLSNLQLVLDCLDLRDWTGITGNAAKLGLGSVSIIFDVLFIVQHYVLYRPSRRNIVSTDEEEPEQEVLV